MNRLLSKLDSLPLWLWVVLSLAGYILLAFWFPLLPHYNQLPLSDIRSLAPSLAGGLAYALLICLLFAFFALAYRNIRRAEKQPGLVQLLGISILFSLPLLLVYPINANDIYRYVIRGRIFSLYDQNPFTIAPDQITIDPFLPLAGEWAGATSPYGPLWELTASTITRISGDSLLLGMLLFKILGLLALLGSALLLWMIFTSACKVGAGTGQQDDSSPAAHTLLWAWNPALLLIFVANGHNDALLIFVLLLGYLFVQCGQEELGFLLMMLGPLVKPIGLLALPIFFISIWKSRPSLTRRLLFLGAIVVGGLLLALFAFLPFGSPWALGQRLLQEAAAGAGYSPAAAVILLVQTFGVEVGSLLGLVAGITTLLFGLFVLWLLWQTWRGRPAVRGTADIFFAYLLQALNFRIWYAAWPFPWLLLDAGSEPKQRTSFRLRYGLWFLLTTQLSVILYGHIRLDLLGGSHLLAHIFGMLFVFALPLLLSWSKLWAWVEN